MNNIFINNSIMDIEDLTKKHSLPKAKPTNLTLQFTTSLYKLIQNDLNYNDAFIMCRKTYKCVPSKAVLHCSYIHLLETNKLKKSIDFELHVIKKLVRSLSGIVVVTIFTAPGKMLSPNGDASCPKDCHYCPSFPNQPKSYDPDEPASMRATQNNFDPILQMFCRLDSLRNIGHPIEKIQLEISGGTWCYYPKEYIDEFVRMSYYGANIFSTHDDAYNYIKNGGTFRPSKSLIEEQKLNETSPNKLIGITIETRPDSINNREIKRLRTYGITRVQLGVQHTDNEILKKINRDDVIETAYTAIELLKVNGFKVDIHIMPDLPGSSPEKDKKMLNDFLTNPLLEADFWKIYPCQVLNYTTIKKWYDAGEYVPWSEKNPKLLCQILCSIKRRVPPWRRINRIVRDFPSKSIHGGLDKPNLRQIIQDIMKENGWVCKCIRCREIKNLKVKKEDTEYVIRRFNASFGTEYFISCESKDRTKLLGFLRLRFNNLSQVPIFNCLKDAGIIRELHVLGVMSKTGSSDNSKYQHFGIGKKLIQIAESITYYNYHLKKIAIIAGVGTRQYYTMSNYDLDETYMVKTLDHSTHNYTNNQLIIDKQYAMNEKKKLYYAKLLTILILIIAIILANY